MSSWRHRRRLRFKVSHIKIGKPAWSLSERGLYVRCGRFGLQQFSPAHRQARWGGDPRAQKYARTDTFGRRPRWRRQFDRGGDADGAGLPEEFQRHAGRLPARRRARGRHLGDAGGAQRRGLPAGRRTGDRLPDRDHLRRGRGPFDLHGRGQEIERVESFSIGTVKQSLSFFVGGRVDAPSFEAAILSARSHFEDAAPPYHPQFWKRCYGSSGTARTIADIIVKNNLGREVNAASLEALKQRFIEFGHVNRIEMADLRPDRAGTIIGGLAILIALVHELDIPVVLPIEAGLRMGVMWDLYLRSTKRDRRESSVRGCLEKFHVDEARAVRVADDASALYAQMKPGADTYTRLLYWSALLHEVGLVVSQTGYHKHAAYMIENADLPGFTTREQKIMRRLILAQKGNLRKVVEALADPDFAKAVVALRLAILFMHSRIELDFRELKLRMKSRIELEIRRDWVAHHPTVSYWMEKEQELWDEVGFDFSIRANS